MGTILDAGLRDDLTDAHREVIDAVGRPGASWTAPERVAIAAEVRRAMERPDLPPWQTPSSTDGMVAPDHPLEAAAIDAVWRITNHPGTLTRDWYDEIVAGLTSPEHYVELVAIAAMMNGIDRLAHFLALEPIPLPAGGAGEPTGERGDDLTVSSHWVPTTGGGPQVMRALSAVPSDRATQMTLLEAQYVPPTALVGDLNWDRGTLDRRQIELVATHTSIVNECFY